MITHYYTSSVLPRRNVKMPNVSFFRAESAETDAAVMTVEAHPGKIFLLIYFSD